MAPPRPIALLVVAGSLATVTGCGGWTETAAVESGHEARVIARVPCDESCAAVVRYRELGTAPWLVAPTRLAPVASALPAAGRWATASLAGLRAGTTYEYQPCLGRSAAATSCGPSRRFFTPWSSSFEDDAWYRDWDGSDPTTAQPEFWPQDPPIGPVDPAQAGLPGDAGHRVMRFTMSPTDIAAGRIHAKLYKTWDIDAARNGGPGLGGDVSGVYGADFLWPADRRLSCRDSAPITVFGWKEVAGSEASGRYVHQDPTWWLTAVPACWVREYPGARWVGPRPRDPGAPVVFTRNWNHGRGSDDAARRPLDVTALPRGRWFSIRAELRDGASIDWRVAGRSLGQSRQSEYPVGPQYGRAPEDRWQFEVGNYGRAPGTLYVDRVFFRRLAGP